jgi:hypothetical protein
MAGLSLMQKRREARKVRSLKADPNRRRSHKG